MAQMIEVTEAEAKAIRGELPEIDLLGSEEMRDKVIAIWASFLRESSYATIAECVALPGMPAYSLAGHTRQVTLNSIALADTMRDFWKIDCDRDALIATALVHDASKLVEREGPQGSKTEIGKALIHAQICGVRCLEYGLPAKVAHMVTLHPFTPPHIHVKPQYIEFVILTWADLAAVDTLFFVEGKPTHLEFQKRFFQLD